MTHRVEIEMTESSYRGDRDERLTTFKIAGEGETAEIAFKQALDRALMNTGWSEEYAARVLTGDADGLF